MTRLPFWDHIEELRKMLIRCGWAILISFLLIFYYHKPLLTLLLAPLGEINICLLNPLEGFSTAAKLSFWLGLSFSSPVWLYFILRFLLPALKPKEKHLLIPFLSCAFLFVVLGVACAYTITLPVVVKFFYGFNAGIGQNLWSLSRTVDLFLGLILAHCLIFQLYVLLIFLVHFRFISYPILKKGRKGVIVAIFVLAAILTPPDVLSQLLLAFPMLILYESALFYSYWKK